VSVHCHERDQEQVEPLAQAVVQAYNEACEALDCPLERRLEVYFAPESVLIDAPRARPGMVWLASPWLSGVAADGSPDLAVAEQAASWGRWAAAAGCAGVRELDPLQRALAAEYATWAGGAPAWTSPLLGRVIERRGPEALPEVFRSLHAGPALAAFLAEWLDLSAEEDAVDYLAALVQIEMEALHAGQRETFLLLQDRAAWWQDQQEAAFDRQQQQTMRWRPETTVEQVVPSEEGTWVVWRASASQQVGGESRRIDYYRRRDGGWVHSLRPFGPVPAMGFDYWSLVHELFLPVSDDP
jgi:hypothetical protein